MSKIEWLRRHGTKPEAWNPVTGCTKVSEGCRHCYAETMARRFWGNQVIANGLGTHADGERPRQFTDVMCHEDRLDAPLRWKKPRTVFVNSMSDLFHQAVPDEFIQNVFTVMAIAYRHTFIVMTKRPERMRALVSSWRADDMYTYWHGYSGEPAEVYTWPLPNVWLGVSAEDQATADQRIPILLQTPAAVRVVSVEPMLGPVKLYPCLGYRSLGRKTPDGSLDWVIVGGESGPTARPCDVAWIRSTVQQCKSAGVPCFVKQLGASPRWDRDDSRCSCISTGGARR